MKSVLTIFSLMVLVSCSHLHSHRDYVAAMEHDDSKFYNPSSDFPVVMGDSGELYESSRTRRARTPASESDPETYLLRELQYLESTLSMGELNQYEEIEPKLLTLSEKIYFLRLPRSDRRFYLISKGFIEDTTQVGFYEASPSAPILAPKEERKPASESEIWPFREYLKEEVP